MTISELISKLEDLKSEFGDIDVVVDDTIDDSEVSEPRFVTLVDDDEKPLHILICDVETAFAYEESENDEIS